MDSFKDQIEEVKSKLDVVDIVGKYVTLKPTGKNFSGKCPFHLEKTPSFIVSPELQRYKCFGCGESGDIFNFVEKIENIDFSETLEKLAKEAGVTLEKKSSNSQYQRIEEINKKGAIYFFNQLKKYPEVLEYVNNRGINKESIQNFGIGYAPGGYGLLDYIQKSVKYSKQELLLSGLFVEKEGKLRSKFFKRVMFPIRSSNGKVIAFTGRVLPDNEYGPKYMNSPETPIYHKADNVYGQYESRQEIRKKDLLIMCEGTTDVISAHQIGVKNIVAPLGTALTSGQLTKLSKLTKNIFFLFDSDSAGQKALERAFILSQPLHLNTYAFDTSPYKDVDEMIKQDPVAFKSILKKRVDAYTYMLTQYVKSRNLSKFEDYQKTASWMNRMLEVVESKPLFSFYVKKGFNITKIEHPEMVLKKDNSKPINKTPYRMPQESGKEAIFLQLVLFQDSISIPKNIDLKYFRHAKQRDILKHIKSNPDCTREEVLSKFSQDEELKAYIENLIFTFSKERGNDNEIQDIYDNIVKEYFVNKEDEIKKLLNIAENMEDTKESEKLLEQFQNLTKEKIQYEQNRKL